MHNDFRARVGALLSLDDDTPCAVVYDMALLRQRARELKNALPGFTHCFALKAAPLPGIVQALAEEGMGFEAASMGEGIRACMDAPGAPVLLDSPAKTRKDIALAAQRGWLMSANSMQELYRADGKSTFLRVNTLVGSGSLAMTSVAVVGSQFGEPHDKVAVDIDVPGLHAHAGSAGMTLQTLAENAKRLVSMAKQRPQITMLNIGGGVPAHASYDEYAQELRRAAPELFEGRWQVFTEMGRSLAAATACAYSKVEYTKPGLAIAHFGADLAMRSVYRPGDWPAKLALLDASFVPLCGPTHPIKIVGPLCFAGDTLGTIEAPQPNEGDVLEMQDAGAYTLSMWNHHCSRPLPSAYGLCPDRGLYLLGARRSDASAAAFWGPLAQ